MIYTIENTTITANQIFEEVSLFVDGKNKKKNNVYLATNGVTVKASSGAEVGSEGALNGISYVIVDLTILNGMIAAQDDITKVCTSLVTDMESMFQGEPVPPDTFNQDLSTWDVSNVTNMKNMFQLAETFNQDISSWDVSSVTNMTGMFQGAAYFSQPIGNWDVSSLTNMGNMFEGATDFNQYIANWSVDNVTSCGDFSINAPLTEANTPNFTNCEPCFIYLDNNGVTIKACSGAVNGDTGVIDNVSYTIVNEATLRTMIENDSILTNKVTTLVTDMSNMFDGRSTFNQDISSWDVSNVTNMDTMFQYASAFNQDISSWDVSNVTIMRRIFNSATAFNQDISNWDVSNVTTMEYMFYVAQSFNQPIGSWDVSSVTDMSGMFGNATAFNKDLSSWSVDNVNNCNGFSDGASSWILPQPNFTLCTP
jgi:surface protein